MGLPDEAKQSGGDSFIQKLALGRTKRSETRAMQDDNKTTQQRSRQVQSEWQWSNP
jgi:hypothetical protein